jgi:DNA polymerase III psi subunit
MNEDLFFLPLFIKEKIYVIAQDFEAKEQETSGKQTSLKDLVSSMPLADQINKEIVPFFILHQEATLLAAQEELLHNILKAIDIPLNQVEKLFIGDFEPTQLTLRKFVFIFSSAKIPTVFDQLEKNQTREIRQGMQAIYSDSLTDLTSDKQKKLALWAALKKTFI